VTSGDFSTGETHPHSRERRDCPACGRVLERDVLPGAPWHLAPGQAPRRLAGLGARAGGLNVVAISVDPRGDTRAVVRRRLTAHHEPANFHYLIGSARQLAPVWKAFYVSPQRPGDPRSTHRGDLADQPARTPGAADTRQDTNRHEQPGSRLWRAHRRVMNLGLNWLQRCAHSRQEAICDQIRSLPVGVRT
jgi:SCO1/SenC